MFVAFAGVKVTTKLVLSPTCISTCVLFKAIFSTFTIGSSLFTTVIFDVAVLLPSFVVTVIVASPGAFAVTFPFWSTSATPWLFVPHVIFLSVAVVGFIVAVNLTVSPTVNFLSVISIDTLCTLILSWTVISHVAVFSVFACDVTVIVAFPSAIAVTFPFASTVAIFSSEDFHVTDLSATDVGVNVGFRVISSPLFSIAVILSNSSIKSPFLIL